MSNRKDQETLENPKQQHMPPPWTTTQTVDENNREELLRTTLKEMMFYGIFVILVTILALGMMFPSMYCLTRVLRELFIQKEFTTTGNVEITFAEIRSAADFWSYCETILFDGFFWDYWYNSVKPVADTDEDDRKILYENKLLGVPRLRQLKVRHNSCEIHEYFRRMFWACYAPFSREAEDTTPFGPKSGSAWNFNTAAVTGSEIYWGKMTNYHGGGYYQDLNLNRNETRAIIADLKKNLWVTRGTRCIFLDFTVYNANLNLFCVVKIVFEFPATGGVIPSSSFKTVKLIRYVTKLDYFIMACEFLVVFYVIFYAVEETIEIIYFRWKYLTKFWNYIDLLIITIGFTSMILGPIRTATTKKAIDKHLHVTTTYANFEYVSTLHIRYNNLIAIFLFLVYVKIFKYLSFNKTMGQLNNTLHRIFMCEIFKMEFPKFDKRNVTVFFIKAEDYFVQNECALDIVGFSVMFFIIFFAYAELGYLIFGTQVEGFSSFGVAMFTLLRTILGDFNYMEIEEANRIFAPIYFLTYIFFVFFVLLNMFLAIINDTYSDVKTEISVTPDEIQMSDYLRRGFYRLLRKCGAGDFIPKIKQEQNEYNVTIEEIRGALKKCGFSELEIEMFFSRYNIDPTAEVGEYDISKLMSNLEGKPYDAPNLPQSSRAAGPSTPKAPLVSIDDFIAQQERLSEIEGTIGHLTTKVDALLKKLDTLDNVRKGPKSK